MASPNFSISLLAEMPSLHGEKFKGVALPDPVQATITGSEKPNKFPIAEA